MKAPCYQCPDRHELCHAECEKYKEYRAWCDEQMRLRRIESANGHSYHVDKLMRKILNREKRGR